MLIPDPQRRAVQPRGVDSRAERLPGRARLGPGQDGGAQQEGLIGTRPVGACMVVLGVAHARVLLLVEGYALTGWALVVRVYGIGRPAYFRAR